MYSSGVPRSQPDALPAAVLEFAHGDPVVAVWENELGGLTFRIGDGDPRAFVKWAPAGSGLRLAEEDERLAWAGQYTPVPRVITRGSDPSGSWLATVPLAGESAVSPRWLADPLTAARAVGAGLRAMHDTLPVDGCPFSWSIAGRAAALTPKELAALPDAPPIDRLVVCHGDPCAPNTLIAENGSWSAHVDLDSLGVADRWADLAIATWSTVWNYGPGFEGAVLEAYGIEPDPIRTAFYRALWELT